MTRAKKTFRFPTAALLGAALLCGPALRAQGGNPMEEALEIARRVDEQLKEVDRLLLESSRRQQPRATPTQLLERSMERHAEATQGIEELIEKLNELKNQSSGGQSQDQQQQQQQQQDQQQQQQQQGERQNRRENQTPDLVQQGEQQQGQQPGEQQQQQPNRDGRPQGGQEQITPGENRQGNQPPEGETGPGSKAEGTESWGELQPYLNSLKNRGSPPTVPQKYRKYWEAYLKNKRDQQQGGGR